MKLAVIGSRGLSLDITPYVPEGVEEIISGGAMGIDTCGERYADQHKLSKHIIRPKYNEYGRGAPLVRNKLIVNECDMVLAFWDGVSRGTQSTIAYAQSVGKPVKVIKL